MQGLEGLVENDAYAPLGIGGPFNVYHSPDDGWGFSFNAGAMDE